MSNKASVILFLFIAAWLRNGNNPINEYIHNRASDPVLSITFFYQAHEA